MKKCPRCQSATVLKTAQMPREGFPYEYHACSKCGEEVLDMTQLGRLADQYRELRKAREAKFATWGNSLGIRIPREMAKELKIVNGTPARLMVENGGIKIVKV